MADRSVLVRLRAQVSDYKQQMQDAAKATGVLADKADQAGKAIEREAEAAKRAATATDKAGREAAAAAAGMDKADKAGTSAATALEKEAAAAREAATATDKAGKEAADAATDLGKAEKAGRGAADGFEKTATGSAKASTALAGVAKSARDNRAEWDHLGTTFTTAGVAIAGGLGLATREAIQWESAWAGVMKTTDGTPEQMADLEGELRELAKTLPSAHEEIAAVAEAAGQLGVAREDISAFTKTAIDLGETTNLSAQEAATGLAQMMNVMRTAPEDVGRLGAALVELGNNGASTEAEILNMASYITGAAQLIGASESDVLALANTMTSLGINAERGGGVMTRTMQDIYSAVQTGGTALEGFAEVAGMSGADFAAAFEADPIRALGAFTDGLATAKDSGENVVGVLADLGIKGTQDTAVLLQMAGAQGMLNDNLDMGSAAWRANNALVDEANKRYETSASRLAIARNQLSDAAIDFGATFVPALVTGVEGVTGVANAFAALPQPVQTATGGLAAVAGAASLALGGAMLLIPRIVETRDALAKLAPAGSRAEGALKGVGKMAGYAAGIATLAIAVDTLGDALSDDGAALGANALADAIDRMAEGDLSNINEQFRNFEEYLGGTDVDDLASAFDRLYNPSGAQGFTDRLDKIAKGIDILGVTGDTEVQRVTARFGDLDATLTAMVTEGNLEQAAVGFEEIARVAEAQGISVDQLNGLFPQYRDALVGAAAEQRAAAESGQAMVDATGQAPGAIGAASAAAAALPTSFGMMVESLSLSEEATDKLRDEIMDLGETMLAFVDPLGAYTGLLDQKTEANKAAAQATADSTASQEDSWENYVGSVNVSVEEYLTALEKQQQDQLNWKTNMLRLSTQVSDGTLEQLARMGPEGAPLVADLVNASDAELQRLDDVFAGNAEDAVFDWGEKIRLAGPVLAQIAGKAGQGAADAAAAELAAGTKTIEQIAADYGVALASGVNPVLTAIGRSKIKVAGSSIRSTQADGSVLDMYADGGVRENHVAQIAPAGAWRVWAEDETGGEAYIPLHPSKRARSLEIYRETGRRLGVDEHEGHDHSYEAYVDGGIRDVQRFANGGFSSTSDVPKRPSYRGGPPLSTAADAVMDKARADTIAWLEENLPLLYPPATAGGNPYLGGGGNSTIVQIGRFIQSQGGRISGHPAWGRVGRHSPTSLHYKGRAIDVNYGGGGANAAENRFVRGLLPTLYKMANFKQVYYREIGGRTDHDDHLHLGIANGAVLDQQKGSAANPHVRDGGGPLLPGYSLNATGGPEQTVLTAHLVDVVSRAATKAASVSGPDVKVFVQAVPDGPWVRSQARVEYAELDRAKATAVSYRMGEA